MSRRRSISVEVDLGPIDVDLRIDDLLEVIQGLTDDELARRRRSARPHVTRARGAPAQRQGLQEVRVIDVLLVLAIAAGLVPLIQRDLRIAYARIEARRRWAAMSPLQRAIIRAARRYRRAAQSFVPAMAKVGAGIAAFGTSLQRAAEEQQRLREREERRRWR